MMKLNGTHLMPGPLYHNGPFMWSMTALLAGNHVVLGGKFDAERTLQLIDEYHPDSMYIVPTMMARIWKLPMSVRDRYDVSSLKVVWHLAAPCPPWLKEAWIEWLGPDAIYELYAGTEAQSATIITGRDWLEHRGSVGRVLSGEMKVFGADGEELPPGEVGEIYMRSADGAKTYEYVGAQAKTLPGGWESLGDMGAIDADGYVYLCDRQTDMILVGGSNVYPAEVEAALDEHPRVRTSAVVGLPDDDLGSRPARDHPHRRRHADPRRRTARPPGRSVGALQDPAQVRVHRRTVARRCRQVAPQRPPLRTPLKRMSSMRR